MLYIVLQGPNVTVRKPNSGPLAAAMEQKKRVIQRDLPASSVATDLDKILGVARLSSIVVQPIVHQAWQNSSIAVLIAASTWHGQDIGAQDHAMVADRSAAVAMPSKMLSLLVRSPVAA